MHGILQTSTGLPRRLFNPLEFNELISGGGSAELDVIDMRRWVTYSGGYRPDSTSIKLFWKVRTYCN